MEMRLSSSGHWMAGHHVDDQEDDDHGRGRYVYGDDGTCDQNDREEAEEFLAVEICAGRWKRSRPTT